MAEASPLTSAHAHARRAAEETRNIKLDLAADEHSHAAHDYARAARGTNDSEARRTLRLLEEHHVKLANIIKSQGSLESTTTVKKQTSLPPTAGQRVPGVEMAGSSTSKVSPGSSTTVTRVGSSQIRDSSPSLARDIASRRGIPQPVRNTASIASQARRRLSPESRRQSRATPAMAANIPPSIMDSQTMAARASKSKRAEDDDAFASFYNNLTTGTMSKLSSVLAYAGLPLAADDTWSERTPKPKSSAQTVSASNEPDVKKIFSKAALNALEDEHRQRGARGHVFGPTESFYVVQKGGGTYSYADIAKAQQQQQMTAIDEDDEDAFVDAREAPSQPSPRQSRRFTNPPRVTSSSGRTHEELELENTTLKQTLEQLATRLTEFETHAQDASMAALTQSMIGLGKPGGTDAAMAERLKQLEQQIEKQAEDKQKLETLAAKQEKTLRTYKAQWGVLVQSAKEKEKAKREKAKNASEEATGEDGGS